MPNNLKTENGKSRMRTTFLIVAWLFLLILAILIVTVWNGQWEWWETVIKWSKQWELWKIAFAIVGLALLFTLTSNTLLWHSGWLSESYWTTFNHTLPLLFVLLPPVFAAIFFGTEAITRSPIDSSPEGQDKLAAFFFPTYYGLMVVVATIFILLQAEIENFIQEICIEGTEERNRILGWRLISAFCLLLGLTAALLYALPYALDVSNYLSDKEKLHLFAFGFLFALLAPGIAIWIRGKLTEEQNSSKESIRENYGSS